MKSIFQFLFPKKKEKELGEGIKPKGVAHSTVPAEWLDKWKDNDLATVHSKNIVIV